MIHLILSHASSVSQSMDPAEILCEIDDVRQSVYGSANILHAWIVELF
jgi:hypothetical protein